MNAEVNAIRTAYEEEGLSPEFISEDRGLDIVAVKACLCQSSAKYRKDCGMEIEGEDTLNFTKDEQQRIKDGILSIAMGAEDEHLRFKALTWCRDDHKGRRDVVRGMAGNNLNVLFLNEQLSKVRNVADRIKQSMIGNGEQQKAINV